MNTLDVFVSGIVHEYARECKEIGSMLTNMK